MALYSPDWINIGFSFILLTVNLFRHLTLIEHGLIMHEQLPNKKECNSITINIQVTVLPAESDSGVMFCLKSYHELIIDRSLVY